MSDPDSMGALTLHHSLTLASGSPRRRELLGDLGVPYQVIVSDIEETTVTDLGPEAQAIALAHLKARVVAESLETGIVLGADTIVVVDEMLLGKPEDDADAVGMLRLLSGREHCVITGTAVLDVAAGSVRSSAVSSTVCMRELREDDIAAYVATGEPRDKAGAYAIQGLGADLVGDLRGCFTNVVGLPLCETARLLKDAGLAISAAWPGCRLPSGAPCPRLD